RRHNGASKRLLSVKGCLPNNLLDLLPGKCLLAWQLAPVMAKCHDGAFMGGGRGKRQGDETRDEKQVADDSHGARECGLTMLASGAPWETHNMKHRRNTASSACALLNS